MARTDARIEAGWIAEHLDDPNVRIIEVDVSAAKYNEGHIPGAILWNAYTDLRDASYIPVSQEALSELVQKSGIHAGTTLVMYGYGAALGHWLMTAYGHGDVLVLEGPREQWEAVGGQWSTEISRPMTSSYELHAADTSLLATRSDVEKAIGDASCVLLDVRSPEEYAGERFWPSGAVHDAGNAGHIPGSVSVPIDLIRNEDGTLRDAKTLERVFAGAGISKDQRIITYCTIGNRASVAWFALKYILGYGKVAVYEGSYVEWGKTPGAAIDAGRI